MAYKEENLSNNSKPRFEFRSFAQNFGIVEEKIRILSAVENIRQSSEIYILSAKNDTHNTKIRNDVLDIKALIQKKKGLEQWQPFMKQAFPISAEMIAEKILPVYQVQHTKLKLIDYSMRQWLDDIVRPHPELLSVHVNKLRFAFSINNCIVEIAEVLINGAFIKTVAVESVDIDEILRVKKLVNLHEYENINYLLALKRITGLAPLPNPHEF
jgi:hypothetical protein